MKDSIKSRLLAAYADPSEKFAFFTGKNNSKFGKYIGQEEWDWTPQQTLNVEPYYWNTHTIPLALGSPIRHTSEAKEWVEPLITNADQVCKLKVPDPSDGRTGEIIQDIKDLLLDIPDDTLIRLPDIQSPLGVAELMWHSDSFYLALLTHPSAVHELLDKITEFTILYIKEIQAILGDTYNPACFPEIWSDPVGYYIADDTNSLVSPEMHLEFSIHYINKITEACGPVHYHSCTWTTHYFDNIRRVKNIKGVHWAINTSDDPAEIINEFSGDYLICPHIGLNIHRGESLLDHNFQSEAELVRYFLDAMQDNTTLYFWFQDELVENLEKMNEIYRLFETHGFLP